MHLYICGARRALPSATPRRSTEPATYTFKTTDFASWDSFDPSDPMASVTITSLQTTGTLKWNGTVLTGTGPWTIPATDISNNKLVFVPNTDVTTQGSFSFEVTDTPGGVTSAPAAMTIKVTADAGPSALASSITATENQTYTFKTSDFGYSDTADTTNHPLASVVITSLPGDGTLKLNGTPVTTNQSITAAQISSGLTTFVPPPHRTTAGSFVLTNFNDPNQSGPFDPKVIYDPYTNRFIVVALQESDAGGTFNDKNTSNILIAVSSPDTGGALTWKYTSINSDVIANGADSWADYPGLSVDGTGNIYVTANLFDHATGNYQGSRLWTIGENDIVTGAAGTNATATGKATIYDPSVLSGATSAGSNELFTLMPAQMLPGSGSFATPSGTYLVSYSGASNSQGKVLNVVEVTPNGSGGFSFTYKQINVGNIDSAGAFSSFTAPQLGTSRTIDAGDDRVYSVVFRNGYLYPTTEVQSTPACAPAA